MEEYKHNYISNVIARADFSTPFFILQDDIPTELGTVCTKYFPILEPRNITMQQVIFNPDPLKTEKKDVIIKEWHFFDKNRDSNLVITTNYVYVEFTKYKNYEDMYNSFTAILEALFKINNQIEIRRFGLRYINNLEMPGSKFAWGPLLNNHLLSIFKINLDRDVMSRAVGNLELNFGNYFIRFQYGMPNPDYPAPIKKKIFTLDYDAYTIGMLNVDEIKQDINTFHEKIKELFEISITQKLRDLMNVD